MREMVFCGAGSFKDVDMAEDDAVKVKPTKAKVKKGKDNPYASRGLDKFSTVLSELETRRERILRRVGPDVDADHLMVRFAQSEAKGWVPIVVKLPLEEEQQAADAKKRRKKTGTTTTLPSTPPTEPASPKEDAANKHVAPAAVPAKKRNKTGGEWWPWRSWGRMVRPRHYWPLALALLLLSLVVFGRVFAICCTSIWWYLLPILSGEETLGGASRSPAPKGRRDAGNKASDTVAPPPPSHGKKSSSGAAHEVISPKNHAHRKKG